jgi:hypothetical protein
MTTYVVENTTPVVNKSWQVICDLDGWQSEQFPSKAAANQHDQQEHPL